MPEKDTTEVIDETHTWKYVWGPRGSNSGFQGCESWNPCKVYHIGSGKCILKLSDDYDECGFNTSSYSGVKRVEFDPKKKHTLLAYEYDQGGQVMEKPRVYDLKKLLLED